MVTGSNAIQLNQISLSFPNSQNPNSQQILESFSLSIQEGDFVALLGPSGCGKSTILRIMADLERADSGTVQRSLRDQDQSHSPSMGYVFQESALLPWRNTLENVSLPLELQGFSKTESQQRARLALAKVGMKGQEAQYPHQLSGGMKMRTSVARALTTGSRIIFFDEPFSALDEVSRHLLQFQLRELWFDQGLTIVFVTHSISEAVYLSNRAVILALEKPTRILLDTAIPLPMRREKNLGLENIFLQEVRRLSVAFPQSAVI